MMPTQQPEEQYVPAGHEPSALHFGTSVGHAVVPVQSMGNVFGS